MTLPASDKFFQGSLSLLTGSLVAILLLAAVQLLSSLQYKPETRRPILHVVYNGLEAQPAGDNETGGGMCLAAVLLGRHNPGLSVLRAFRDRVLSATPTGRRYARLYYQYSTELVSIMRADTNLRAEARRLLMRLLPRLAALPDPAAMDAETKRAVIGLLSAVREKAGPALAAALEDIQENIHQGSWPF